MKRFEGLLKQHATERLSPLGEEFVRYVFPHFLESTPAEQAYYSRTVSELKHAWPDEKPFAGQAVPTRYAGWQLSRGRYHTLCTSESGDDAQTLAHELRAYRHPVRHGMVEVFDLTGGVRLQVGDSTIRLDPELSLAVLIHEPRRLPGKFNDLDFQRLPGLKGEPALIFRLPYKVRTCELGRVVDLRYPDEREWFHKKFRIPGSGNEAAVAEGKMGGLPPFVMRSMFRFDYQRPPVPKDFWSMLPTLLNPMRGGGSPGGAGSTFAMIGNWMRQNDVDALIYPSARADVSAEFESGVLKRHSGWNLLDFRDAPVGTEPRRRVVSFVTSPWCWASLPDGVRLTVKDEASEFAGSFAVRGIVDFSAGDYLRKLAAVKVASERYGPLRDESDREPPAGRVLEMGALLLRWVRRLLDGSGTETAERDVAALLGLGLAHGLFQNVGHIAEVYADIRRRKSGLYEAIDAGLWVDDQLGGKLKRFYPSREFERLVRVGSDLEMTLLTLAGTHASAIGGPAGAAMLGRHLDSTCRALETDWLSDEMRRRAGDYYASVRNALHKGAPDIRALVAAGEKLHATLSESLPGDSGEAGVTPR